MRAHMFTEPTRGGGPLDATPTSTLTRAGIR
jgi:hypothetical protein